MGRRVADLLRVGSARPPSHWLAVALVFGAGLGLTLIAYRAAREAEAARLQGEFHNVAVNRAATVRKALALNLELLRSTESFYASLQVVGRQDFRAFAASALAHRRGITALHWAPRIPGATRRDHEQAVIAEGVAGYRIGERGPAGRLVPARERAEYFPICYSEPNGQGPLPLGLDLAANAEWASLMARACQEAKPLGAMHGGIGSDAEGAPVLEVLLPLYRTGAPRGTPDERQAGLMGFVVGVYLIPALMDEALGELILGPVRLEVYDETEPDSPRLLCSYPPAAGAARPAVLDAGELVYTEPLNAAGRRWTVRCVPTAELGGLGATWPPGSVLLGGTLATLVLAGYLASLVGRASRVERLVTERTAELARANQDLGEEVSRRKATEDALRESQQALELRVQDRTRALQESVQALHEEVAQRVQAEQEARRARDELEVRVRERTAELARSNARLEEFAYAASHDLQEPLRMVTSFLQLLLERAGEKLDAEGREFVGYAADGAERMQRMIRGLLAYSRVDQHGKGFAPTSLEAVLDQALRNLTTAVAENQAVVTHGPLPTLMGDEPLLVELLQNLIGNAIKFRRAEAPCIHVWAVRQNQEWVFAVRDNGIGIEPRHTERVFRIFQRLHSRTQYPGTGIGLALCARIVEHHHGRIWVDSVPGQGSTFRFTLPSTPGASSDEPDHRAGG